MVHQSVSVLSFCGRIKSWGHNMYIYQFINKLFDYINRKSQILIHTPWPRNIGNCAEEIYYGLLKARRDGKKIVFLFPHRLFWKFCIGVGNSELFKIESDYCLSNNNIWCYLSGWLLTVVFGPLRFLYLLLYKLYKCLHVHGLQRIRPEFRFPPVNVWYTLPSIGRTTLWKPEGVNQFSWEIVSSFQWKRQYDEYLPVKLEQERHKRAEQLRVEMGIPLTGWYVCLHVREGGFHKDAWVEGTRNASILNYIKGIKVITDAGGFVVRMGDPSMMKLPLMERVIDYPHTPYKCELMDIYLISQCHFYVGVNSGPLDIAWLFQKRVVLTNLTEWLMSFPKKKGDLSIIKHIFSRSRNRFLSLKEILNEPFECQYVRELGNDYIMFENSSEEIKNVIVECLNTSADYQYSELQETFNEGRRAQIHRWLERSELFFENRLDDLVERYRLASRADSVKGALGRKYVEQNWISDSMNNYILG